ncbi:DUF1845 domain-containing protein [Herbaspirillum sp. HC18]|nr:DUF1845 domain-containing protein [Herbaspirillum sp. HC18]
MTESRIVRTDEGAVNARILAKEVKADFRRIEAASVKMMTRLSSAEAKRQFVRYFNTLQLNAHFVSVIARTKLQADEIARVEDLLREQLVAVADELNHGIDGAEALFKAHGITRIATYDTLPLELEVGIISSSGRRYFEILNKLDQLMPMLQTMEVHEVITAAEADRQRAGFKRAIRRLAVSARNLASGLRRRMNALDALKSSRERSMAVRDNNTVEGSEEPAVIAAGVEPDSGNGGTSARFPAASASSQSAAGLSDNA